jgi:hypothetical protein
MSFIVVHISSRGTFSLIITSLSVLIAFGKLCVYIRFLGVYIIPMIIIIVIAILLAIVALSYFANT